MGRITASTTIEELAAIVSTTLEAAGISAVLSGGAVVSIYTNNEYESSDLDFISHESTGRIAEAIAALGFKREGRMFFHPRTPLFVEFPAGPLAIGDQLIRATEVAEKKTPAGTIRLLTPTQSVMDRLAAYFHWNDLQSLDQAVMVASSQKISLNKLETWARREGASDKLAKFKQQLAARKRQGITRRPPRA
jgi:hypothetical protein